MDAHSGYLIYEIDDLMYDGKGIEGIPLYNRGRHAFEGEEIQGNIRAMLNAADFVITTTDHIKDVYHEKYGVPYENMIALPNLLPKYLFGGKFNVEEKIDQFKKNKAKPRIGIVSSLSHYNVDGVRQDKDGFACRLHKDKNGQPIKDSAGNNIWLNQKNEQLPESETQYITDDFDEIVDCVRSTYNDVQWVFFGYCPPKVEDLAKANKIKVHGGVPIMNYPGVFHSLNLQAIVAPIKNMEFNWCKSFIKYMEAAALGVPLFASNCLPYDRIMPKDQLFNSSDELKQKILGLKFSSVGAYQKTIEAQWKWLNSPCHEGDFDLKNFWLEDNLQIYIDLNRLRPKTLNISYANFEKQYKERQEKEKQDTLFKNENVTILK